MTYFGGVIAIGALLGGAVAMSSGVSALQMSLLDSGSYIQQVQAKKKPDASKKPDGCFTKCTDNCQGKRCLADCARDCKT